MTNHASILGREPYLGFYVGECPHVPNLLVMGQSNGCVWEKKLTNSGCIPSLINNKYHQFIKGNVEFYFLGSPCVPQNVPNTFSL
jgi:hypothetical protein